MLHIATVHWRNEEWIDLQLGYLKKHVAEPYRVYAFLNEIPESQGGKFHYASFEPIREHARKLNLLAGVIQSRSDVGDRIMFLDGDAFPIRDLGPLLDEKLASRPLVAVQRLENNGDRQPHPCFCVTTVGFWTSIEGDWNEGFRWADQAGNMVTDVGGNLLGILESRRIGWAPLVRTNRVNLHPLWFGIYGDAVYHHGAGFRDDKVSRADLAALAQARSRLSPAARGLGRLGDWLLSKSPIRRLRAETAVHRASRRNKRLSDDFMERIRRDEEFYRQLR